MRVALINPNWQFEGSIYFGCREPHLPLEYGYARALLNARGHDAILIDAHLNQLTTADVRRIVEDTAPDACVVTTAPSYLFWRCAPPELRVPMEVLSELQHVRTLKIVIGPHVSTTPRAALRKLNADAGILGEPEELLARLIETPRSQWGDLQSVCYRQDEEVVCQGGVHQSNMMELPPLRWPAAVTARHRHHHHRFDAPAEGPGAEVEVSRGCPYHCTFCAKDNFRSDYRKRPVHSVLDEIDGLRANGVRYFYFIDEIFLPDTQLLTLLCDRNITFGVQTRVDLWKPEMLDLLGRAGCVSIEAGVESISEEGRDLLDKQCRLSTDELTERLVYARQRVPFVQANLIGSPFDNEDAVEKWRNELGTHGVWANKPVPLFPYPGSPDYTRLWGAPDDLAWERAHDHYLREYSTFSDIQEDSPKPLGELEAMSRRE